MEETKTFILKTIEELKTCGDYEVVQQPDDRIVVQTGYGPVVTFDFYPDRVVCGVYPKPNVREWLTVLVSQETEIFGLSSNVKFRSPFDIKKGSSPFNYETTFSGNVFKALLKKSLTLLKKDSRLGRDTFSFRPSRDLCDYVGKGAYSSIWRDTKLRVIKVCAIKDAKASFINEVVILKNHRHRNIIKFLDSGNYGGDYAYRMELADTSLGKYLLWNYKLNPDLAEMICEDVAHGVAFLHSHNILHGDLSTNNIAVFTERAPNGYDITAKITDLGTARILRSRVSTETYFTTEGFRLPEKDYSGSFAFDLDVWAMGCIFYSCYYGKGYSGLPDPERDCPQEIIPPRPTPSKNPKIDHVIWDMCLVPKRASAAQVVKVWSRLDYEERYDYKEPVISEEVVDYESIPLLCEENLFVKSFI